MSSRTTLNARYATLLLLLFAMATNREDEKTSQKNKLAQRMHYKPIAVVPVLGIRG
jgi:hypothetical protein